MKRIDEQEESDDEIRDLKENIITNIVKVWNIFMNKRKVMMR